MHLGPSTLTYRCAKGRLNQLQSLLLLASPQHGCKWWMLMMLMNKALRFGSLSVSMPVSLHLMVKQSRDCECDLPQLHACDFSVLDTRIARSNHHAFSVAPA